MATSSSYGPAYYTTADKIKETKKALAGSAKAIEERKEEIPYHSVNEPSIVHPWNQSLIKIRDNGTIDVMSGTDNGVRINPGQRTVDILARTANTHASFIRAFVLRDEIRYVKNDWTLHCNNANIKAKSDIRMMAGKDVSIYAKNDIIFYADGGKNYFNTRGYKGIED